MNLSISTLFVFLLVPTIVCRAPITRDQMSYLLEQSQIVNDYPGLPMLFRMRRTPEDERVRACGEKYRNFVLGACGGLCTIHSDVDLASKCCHFQCTQSDLKTYCCP